ncbi:MAG: HD domain-containing protein [Lachnospiraceae bacterium]
MIKEAAEFAKKAHEGIFRKGSHIPYICHPMEVAVIVAQMTGDRDVIAAAYLHDVIEDTDVTGEELRERFGERIYSLVAAETEDKTKSWQERKQCTIRHLLHASREVKLLALADKLSNMRSTAMDYLVVGDEVWKKFNEKHKERHQWYMKGVLDAVHDLSDYPAYQELECLYKIIFGT